MIFEQRFSKILNLMANWKVNQAWLPRGVDSARRFRGSGMCPQVLKLTIDIYPTVISLAEFTEETVFPVGKVQQFPTAGVSG